MTFSIILVPHRCSLHTHDNSLLLEERARSLDLLHGLVFIVTIQLGAVTLQGASLLQFLLDSFQAMLLASDRGTHCKSWMLQSLRRELLVLCPVVEIWRGGIFVRKEIDVTALLVIRVKRKLRHACVFKILSLIMLSRRGGPLSDLVK